MEANKDLVRFMREARRRGFDDYQIRAPLLKQGWPHDEIEKAFNALTPKYKFKNRVCVFLDSQLLRKLDNRAKRNMLTVSEQIEDILRRSALTFGKRTAKEEKLDDKFVALFSRKCRKK